MPAQRAGETIPWSLIHCSALSRSSRVSVVALDLAQPVPQDLGPQRHLGLVVMFDRQRELSDRADRVFLAGGDAGLEVMGMGERPWLPFSFELLGVVLAWRRKIVGSTAFSAMASAVRPRSSCMWIRIIWMRSSIDREYSGQIAPSGPTRC